MSFANRLCGARDMNPASCRDMPPKRRFWIKDPGGTCQANVAVIDPMSHFLFWNIVCFAASRHVKFIEIRIYDQ